MSDERLLDVAAAILDGSSVEWSHLEHTAAPDDARILDELRALARITDVHRRAHAAPLTSWGPFAVAEPIGSGTFGDVYRASDPVLDRDIALKLLRSPASDRLLSEGRLLARVRHPNVVTIYGAARHEAVSGIWMEFVRGQTLAAVVAERGPFAAAETMANGRTLCGALAAVHDAGLLHGDIKAQNVMRDASGRIVLMDFGTGRVAGDDTLSARVAGTPLYVAPELLAGETPDAASDVYSLGVLLYFLLTGTFPVTGRTLGDIRDAHAAGIRVPVRRRDPKVPRRIAAVVDRAVAPRAARFQTARDFEAAIAGAARPAYRRPLPLAAAAVMLAMIVTGAAWRAIRPPVPLDQLQFAVVKSTVTASDPDGRVVWRRDVDPSIVYEPAKLMSPPWKLIRQPEPALFVAFDIGTRRGDEKPVDGRLFELDPGTGRTRRTFSFDDRVTIGGENNGGPWPLMSFAVDERAGARRIAASAHHYNWDASLVTLLDASFHRQGTYVQAGWLDFVMWLAPDRLLASGYNNAHEGGSIVLLDPDHLDGQSPEPPDSRFFCRSCAPAPPLKAFVLPRTELNRVTLSRFNRTSVDVLGDRIVAHTSEIEADLRGRPTIEAQYEFTPSLELVRASFGNGYWEMHDALQREGKLTHSRADCPDRDGPREVLVWERGGGWRRVPVPR